jgi:hypothetical protein
MVSGFAQARQRIRESLKVPAELTIILDSTGSPSSRLQARFLAQTGDVLKVQTTVSLGCGMAVSVAGEIDTPAGKQPVLGRYRAGSSRPSGIGTYNVELLPEPAPEESSSTESSAKGASPKGGAEQSSPSPESSAGDLDYYEILQVSRHADTDTIHRVFHILAQRYHPDNRETGSDARFRQVVEAHRLLADVERRAAYDVRLAAEDKTRHTIFDNLQSSQGVQAEVRKRQGILRLLYTKRLVDPLQPCMRGREFAEMLGCPLEHLEFSLWFLRDTRMIQRSDNNRFEITSLGVQAFEAQESNYSRRTVLPLPAAAEPLAG